MKRLSTYIRWLNVGLIALVSCDQIDPDFVPVINELPVDNQFVALIDQQLAIDIKKIPQLTTATTFRIQKQPELGDAHFTAQGFLVYTPQPGFVAGEDELVLVSDQKTTDGLLPTVPLRITMAAADDKLSCRVGAVSDVGETVAGRPVSVSVLKNDQFCSGTIDPATLTIESPPKNGTVKIEGDHIVYTPKEGYKGRDGFVYQICNKGAQQQNCSVAAVTLIVVDPAESCTPSLEDNVVAFKPVFVGDSVRIPVLANDKLCRSNPALPIKISLPPVYGTAYVTQNNVIVYKARQLAGSDEFTYQRCDGTCLDAVVQIKERSMVPNCTITAGNDAQTISIKRLSADVKANGLLLPILANDTICELLTSIIIKENPSNAKVTVQRDGKLLYLFDANPKPGQVTFIYEVTDAKGNKASAEVKITLNQ